VVCGNMSCHEWLTATVVSSIITYLKYLNCKY
jgi:hypothetical protein